MSSTGPVVVGYNGGADAVAFGAAWARAAGLDLVVATVHPGPAPVGPQRVDVEWAAEERADAVDRLEDAQHLLGDQPGDVRRVESGSPAHGLHDVSTEVSASLLVVGAHRGAGHGRTRTGSTAGRLMHGSAAPVAVVPRGWADGDAPTSWRVAVGWVATPDGATALAWAGDAAVRVGGRLRVLSVVPDTRGLMIGGEPRVFASAQRRQFDEQVSDAVDDLACPNDSVEPVLLEGPVAETLTRLGREDADLLVVGSRGYGPVRTVLLGGVSRRVVQGARLPVVVVPRG